MPNLPAAPAQPAAEQTPRPLEPKVQPKVLPPVQPRNPLHGLTLEAIVAALADYYGWDNLGQRIALRCFTHDPSVASSLKFLRKTPWAREKVEGLYLYMLREQQREQRREQGLGGSTKR